MSTPTTHRTRLALTALAGLLACAALHAAEIRPAADAPRPKTPEESRRCFRLPEGFEIELVASEPLLAEPTGIAFDARGRLFVCELHGYNLEGHYDVQELNRKGVLDRKVRRIPASREAQERAKKETYGTVKLLLDTDGDGKMDRAVVWADRLPPCYGLVPARDGVIVLCAPEVVYLADAGEGRPARRETLFKGFGVGELWTRINNPRWGLDNWVYATSGAGSGGTVRGPHLKGPVRLPSTGFRFKPDGSALEPVTGGTEGFGLALTDWGDRFVCTNQRHALFVAPLPYRYLKRNAFVAAPAPQVNVCTYGTPARLFPTSKPDPWRARRASQPEWVRFYGAAETSAGLFTSACAPVIYRADMFPKEYRGSHFSCEPAQNLVHRCLLSREGLSYRATRAREGVEFLTSTDQWFRPVNLTVGPDGALYVVDMYREIIEDYSAIPRYLQQQYGLVKGRNRGRIWRITYKGARERKTNLASLKAAQLVEELSSANSERRQTAQRLLVERGAKDAAGALAALARGGATPQARLHALYTLEGLKELSAKVVVGALDDAHPEVRRHALRLAEPWLGRDAEVLEKVLRRARDPDVRVRLQAALTLGETRDRRAVRALAGLAARDGTHEWVRAAVLSSVPDRAPQLIDAILALKEPGHAGALLGPLAGVVGARRKGDEVRRLLESAAGLEGEAGRRRRTGLLAGLVAGLGRSAGGPGEVAGAGAALRKLLGADPQTRRLALRAAGLLKLDRAGEVRAAFRAARKEALDARTPLERRVEAVRLLASAPHATLAPVAEKLLDPRQPPALQKAAVEALAESADPGAGKLLLAGWKTYSPATRAAVLDAVLARRDRLPALLDAIEKGTVHPGDLDGARRERLTASGDAKVRARAKALLGRAPSAAGRDELFRRYQKALAGPRDPRRGEKVYLERCAQCHRLKDRGYAVGPDLATAASRADETLLLDVLDPSGQITPGFRSYTVETTGGRVYGGVLAAETATSVTLRREKGEEDVILRKNIERMVASEKSLMPDDLHKVIGPKDFADLLGYLRKVLGPVPGGVVLFDDEETFVKALAEGEGKASLVREDRYSGSAALLVTPPQRFAARIPGWDYRIVEKPGPGEYRYLRLAWKARGKGVMVELAADGRWPDAARPERRYYSGTNTTGWKAKRVSPEAPREWVVVTLDLWKDAGAFTLTGIAPTALGGPALFDRIELLASPDAPAGKR